MGLGRIIILLLVIGIVVGILWSLGLQEQIPCSVGQLKMLAGLEEYYPRDAVGTNLQFEVAGFQGCTDEQQSNIRNWLPGIHDNLVGGCLGDVDIPAGIAEDEIDRRALRNKMIGLMTCESLEIICDHAPICNQGVSGYTHGPDLDQGRNRFYICFRDPGAILSPAVTHEIGHIALYFTHPSSLYVPQIWLNEDLAGNIGRRCGDIR